MNNDIATPKPKRTWKTWQLITVAVGGLILGGAAGGGSSGDDTKVKDLEAKVATYNGRIEDATSSGQAVKDEYTTKLAGLDTRTGELDARQADLDAREQAVGVKETAKKSSTFEDGVLEVGVDIMPGTYKTAGGDGCYWEKSNGGEGIGAIIGNSYGQDGPQTVVIEPSVKLFTSNNCGTWTKR